MKNIEQNYDGLSEENSALKNKLKTAEYEIDGLKEKISFKDKLIDKLQAEKDKFEKLYHGFKAFWYDILKRFQGKIAYDKDNNYRNVADDLIKSGVFDDNETEIVNNPLRKIKIKEELQNTVKQRKPNVKE